jgi:hypothetical protein
MRPPFCPWRFFFDQPQTPLDRQPVRVERVEALRRRQAGFQKLLRTVVVHVGNTVTVNFELLVGTLQQSVEATAAPPGISMEKYSVSGVVSRFSDGE